MKYLTIVYAIPSEFDVSGLTENEMARAFSWSHKMHEYDEATRKIERLHGLLAECAPMVYANSEVLHMLDGFCPQEREYDDLARRLRKELVPNVELTGVARVYRAASSDQRERG